MSLLPALFLSPSHVLSSYVPPPLAEVGIDSDEDEDTLDGEMEAVEGTPESFKLPALKARKAHKYVNQVNKEGGYFSPKYVPVNPGLQSDDVM